MGGVTAAAAPSALAGGNNHSGSRLATRDVAATATMTKAATVALACSISVATAVMRSAIANKMAQTP